MSVIFLQFDAKRANQRFRLGECFVLEVLLRDVQAVLPNPVGYGVCCSPHATLIGICQQFRHLVRVVDEHCLADGGLAVVIVERVPSDHIVNQLVAPEFILREHMRADRCIAYLRTDRIMVKITVQGHTCWVIMCSGLHLSPILQSWPGVWAVRIPCMPSQCRDSTTPSSQSTRPGASRLCGVRRTHVLHGHKTLGRSFFV